MPDIPSHHRERRSMHHRSHPDRHHNGSHRSMVDSHTTGERVALQWRDQDTVPADKIQCVIVGHHLIGIRRISVDVHPVFPFMISENSCAASSVHLPPFSRSIHSMNPFPKLYPPNATRMRPSSDASLTFALFRQSCSSLIPQRIE